MNPPEIATYEVNYGTELFVDDVLIAERFGVMRNLHPATKLDAPVIIPEPGKPWEYNGSDKTKRVYLLGTTIYDKQVDTYHMWYMARMDANHGHRIPGLYVPRTGAGESTRYDGRRRDNDGRYFAGSDIGDLLCYAESDDGLHWTKPDLGVFAFDDSPNNNIVWDLHGASVFIDNQAQEPEKRYKAIGFCRRYRNIFLITSPDGIHWSDADSTHPVIERANEGPTNVVYDEKTERYLAYMLVNRGNERRHIEYSESKSLNGKWTGPTTILEPNREDDTIGQTRHGAIRAEYYNMSGFPYGGIYIGILSVLYVTADIAKPLTGQAGVDGPIDAQLVYSRDGVTWHHFEDRSPIIPRGDVGSFDSGMIIFTAKEPLVKDNGMHWYYTGSTETHGGLLKDKVMSIGRASWRLDGFVSLDADANGGTVETVPLRIPDGRLEVNVDATQGSLAVEVLFPDGRIQPGFSAKTCSPIRGDHLHHPVNWTQIDLTQAQQPLRLRFSLRQAKLYSFRIVEPRR